MAAATAAADTNSAAVGNIATILDGKIAYGRITFPMYMEQTIQTIAVNDGDTGAHAGNSQIACDIQITGQS